MVTLFKNGVDMVRRKVYLKNVEGHIGANHLTSAEEIGDTPGSEDNVFETVLLGDVFESIYASTRYQHDIVESEPLRVLVSSAQTRDEGQRLGHVVCQSSDPAS